MGFFFQALIHSSPVWTRNFLLHHLCLKGCSFNLEPFFFKIHSAMPYLVKQKTYYHHRYWFVPIRSLYESEEHYFFFLTWHFIRINSALSIDSHLRNFHGWHGWIFFQFVKITRSYQFKGFVIMYFGKNLSPNKATEFGSWRSLMNISNLSFRWLNAL